MAASELSIEAIHEYFVEKGGIVANREVVKQFKKYLTDPATKDDARIKFKKFINTLATTKTEGDEKFLILRPKYSTLETQPSSSSSTSSIPPYNDPRNSIGIPISPSHSVQDFSQSPNNSPRQPPPYRPPPPPPQSPSISLDNVSLCSSNISMQEPGTPQPPPRRRSTEKGRVDEASQRDVSMSDDGKRDPEEKDETLGQECDKQPISVKERTQKFNRMASVEDELSPRPQKEKKKQQDKGADEDDGASVTSLDQKKCTEWLVTAAKGDYQELAKLASDEPRLVKLKDPFTAYTVLHWGAKHGNENIIKLFAGKYKADVNSKTNGGYTPLHMAVQFGHKKVYSLLVEVYRANPDIRDFSGRKANQYETSQTQAANKDTFSEYRQVKPNRTKHQSFLRKNFAPNQRRYKSAMEATASSFPTTHSRFYGSYSTR